MRSNSLCSLIAVLLGFSISSFASHPTSINCGTALPSLNASELPLRRTTPWVGLVQEVLNPLNEKSHGLRHGLFQARGQRIKEVLDRAKSDSATASEIHQVASFLVARALWEAQFAGWPAEGAMALHNIHTRPESVFPPGFEPSSQLLEAVRGLVPADLVERAKQLSGLHTDLDVEVQQALSQGPEARRALLKRFIERQDIADWRMDLLTGLDDERIREDDLRNAPRGPMKDEKVFLNDAHSFYGSGYGGFSEYDKTLNIPSGGTVCDLGAGPFLAAASYGVLRPDVTVVGYELLPARVKAGRDLVNNLGLKEKARLHEANLSDPKLQLEVADGYILMNPFPEKATTNLIRMLKDAAKRKGRPVRLVVYDQAGETLTQLQREPNSFRKIAFHPGGGNSKYAFFTFELTP